MNGMLLGVIALGLFLVCLWIWMNILLTRPKRNGSSGQSHASRSDVHDGLDLQERPDSEKDWNPEGRTTVEPHPTADAEQFSGVDAGADVNTAASVAALVDREHARELELMETDHAKSKVFGRASRPFHLNALAAPLFAQDAWTDCFLRLAEEPAVLGWIAFYQNSVGASDRDYDDEFVDVLRTYKGSVEKLRRQVGLTQVIETSVVGDEGKVWFLTPVEDTWMALFVDRDADIERLSDRLLAPVRQGDGTH